MFKITLQGSTGQSETVDLTSANYYTLYAKFNEYGITPSPHDYKIKDTEQEDAPVKIHSDSDVGNAALTLLHDNDTVYDAYLLEQGLANVRDEIKDDIEQALLYEQYGNTEQLYDDIRQTTIGCAATRLTFYCPLIGNLHYFEDGDYGETDNDTLLDHSDQIEDKLKAEQSPEMNMAKYVGEHADIADKLIFAEWTVDEIGDTLYGRIDCYLSESLNPEETERLRSAIIGQNSDGFGESFEQREIPISDGNLYVSFWNNSDDYFLHTSDEMEEYISQQNGIKFGGS